MEVILNLLSLLCFCFAAREAVKGRSPPGFPLREVMWVALAFLWSSADDIPFLVELLGPLRIEYWYPFDLGIHAVSLVFFYLAARSPRGPEGRRNP